MNIEEAIVDLINNGQIQGEFANQLMANGKMDIGAMRPFISKKDGKSYVSVYKGGDVNNPESYVNIQVNNGTLRRDEWKALDEAVTMVAESRLVGINDLTSRGLVYNLTNAMGSTVLETQAMSDAMEAEMTMDGVSRSKGDRPVFSSSYLPIPIIHVDYEINARALAASRNMGGALDTTSAERAARKVAEKLENMLFTNTTYTFGGGTIYSYLNHPHRGEVTLSLAWDDSSKTPKQILDDVLALKKKSTENKHYGPWVLYIPTSYETVLDEDYITSVSDTTQAGTSNTIRDRILKIGGIQDVKVVDTLPDDNIALVQMTSDVVRLVRGMGIQNVQWQTEGMFINKYKVLTIQVPQIRSDFNSKTGIVHLH